MVFGEAFGVLVRFLLLACDTGAQQWGVWVCL